MNTVPHPLPPLCKNLDNFKNPATHPLYKNTPPKNFLKNFEKTQAEKKPPVLAGGLKGSLDPRRSNEPTEVASKPNVSIYFAHRDSNPQSTWTKC
jgi:hypothetical protein